MRILLLLLASMAIIGCREIDYPTVIEKEFSQFLTEDELVGFRFYGQPKSGPGVGSMYYPNALDPKAGRPQLLTNPERWFRSDVPIERQRTVNKRIIFDGINEGFASNTTYSTSSDLGFALPLKGYLASVGFEIEGQRGVTVSFSADKLIAREIVFDELYNEENRRDLKQSISNRLTTKNYVIIDADYYLEGMKIRIDVDESVNPSLNASLAVAPEVIEAGSLKMTMKKVRSGVYELASQSGVVIAVSFGKAPDDETRSTRDSGWEGLELNNAEFRSFEERTEP
ncbi:MAG: hypothetical protein AAGM16_03005 [Pseudomonadota bacterium]